jgi:hypothetical protein
MTRREMIRWLNTEAHVMPARKRRQFARFLETLDPPQARLPLSERYLK